MDTDQHGYKPDLAIEAVVGAAFEVANVLGPGFLEKVYERALLRELRLRGVRVRAQVAIPVSYKGVRVGHYSPDLLIDERLIVELKCVDSFNNEHVAQCVNYLKATGFPLALLVNFQHAKVEWRRVIWH